MVFKTSLKYCVYGIFIGVPVAGTFHDIVGGISEISGRSMRPTFNPEDSLTCDKVWVSRWGLEKYRPLPGDIVTLISPINPRKRLIKRVIATEGEIVKSNRQKYVKVPTGHCWIEGDNSRFSQDSNYFGPARERKRELSMPLEGIDEEGLPHNPDLEAAQLKFLLTLEDTEVDKENVWQKLLEVIKEKSMGPFYIATCHEFQRDVDQGLAEELKRANDAKVEELDLKREDTEKNFGEVELRDVLMEKSEYLCQIGDKEKAVATFRLAYDKTVALGYRMDVVFYLLRIGLFYTDHDLIKSNIEKAQSLIEEGGDWDRRNRLKVYRGVYAMQIRDFKTAAVNFFEAVSTFTSTELMPYRTFVKYAVFSCMVALPRKDLKEKVINGADVLEVLHGFPELMQYVNSLYYCHYDKFFESLIWVEEQFKQDRYLSLHTRYYIREMRVKAYSQLLESYRSLSLTHMAKSFGVTESFMDRELSRFISSGRLHCRIDKVAGVVETNRPDSKNFLYQSTIKQGDLLLNRVQKLSRVINI